MQSKRIQTSSKELCAIADIEAEVMPSQLWSLRIVNIGSLTDFKEGKKRNIIMKSNSGISTSNQIKECTNLETNLKWYVWTIRSIKNVKISTSVGYFT
jgi:hypothetical protein